MPLKPFLVQLKVRLILSLWQIISYAAKSVILVFKPMPHYGGNKWPSATFCRGLAILQSVFMQMFFLQEFAHEI